MIRRWLLAFLLVLAAPPIWADDAPAKKTDDPRQQAGAVLVPYRLTDTHHVMVRAKLNGKGPFNFIVDTGCPVLIVSSAVGKKLGVKPDAKGWTLLDKLELEGGLVQEKVKCRVETPFQIEGMNAMGLPGVELHGLLGYTVIAKYKMEFDFKHDQMRWTPLAFDPPAPAPLGGSKGNLASLEAMGGLMKFLSAIAGIKPAPPPVPRGFFGFELVEKDSKVLVDRVLAKSPAAQAGLKAGDQIESIDGEDVKDVADVFNHTAKVTVGRPLSLTVSRNGESQTLKITAGNGL
jgi:membrane-associated protease RseP (regulator of RpoE activity)